MLLNLKDIVQVPGGRAPFSFTLEPERLTGGYVTGFDSPPAATGEVRNSAGLLLLEGRLTADMRCLCDRCGKETRVKLNRPVSALLSDGGENPDAYPLAGDCADLSEIFETSFILGLESRFLCGPDCRGLCPGCGRDLNQDDCACETQQDPRMAVLEQLLDKPED